MTRTLFAFLFFMAITTSIRAEEECSRISKIFSNKCEQEKIKKEIDVLKRDLQRQKMRNDCIKDLPVKSGPIADILC